MQRNKNHTAKSDIVNSMSLDLGSMPLIEMTGNRRITIEGSTGILLYESECIKINTNKMVISFSGWGLCVKCITNSCVEVAGFITGIEFMTWGDFYDA